MLVPPIQAVLFDAVGTLIFPEPSAALAYADVGRRHGSQLPVETIRARFHAAFARQEALDQSLNLRTSEERERERWQAIVDEVLTDVDNPAACFKDLFEHFSQPASWRCASGTGQTLQELADQGFQLALASNYDSRLRALASGMPPLQPIKHLIISSEIGWRKPARAFFDRACQLLDVQPARVLVVGDDQTNEIDGALAAGMQAILYDPQGKCPGGTRPRIACLDEVVVLLASR